jgi:ribonuclease P/MRP protein subunit RPP1
MIAVGYNVVGCTISSEPSNSVPPNPFLVKKPFPDLDPRTRTESTGEGSSSNSKAGGRVVQVTRFHIRLDDNKTHCFVCLINLHLIRYPLLRPGLLPINQDGTDK